MGRCTLTFDQIEIVNKKTGTGHLDNDWLIVAWQINGTPQPDKTETFGRWILDSGQAVSVACRGVECTDTDIVTAVISMVNLDALDFSDQVQTVGDIGRDIAQKTADVYLEIVKDYVKYAGYADYIPGVELVLPDVPGPLADLTADAIEALKKPIEDAIGTMFDDVIIPLLNDLIAEVRVLVGQANCNGDVFHDVIIFPASSPMFDTSVDKTYEASHITGCGSAARTRVIMTMHRDLQMSGFANTPPPQVEIVPAGSDFDFTGIWVDDPGSHTPRIVVAVTPTDQGPSRLGGMHRGPLYDVTVLEHVDPRFNADFETAAKGVAPHPGSAFPYVGDEFGSIRSVATHPVARTGMGVFLAPSGVMAVSAGAAPTSPPAAKKKGRKQLSARTSVASRAGKAVAQPAPQPLMFKQNWRTVQPTGGLSIPLNFSAAAKTTPASAGIMRQQFWLLEFPGVTLVALTGQANGKTFGGALRYIREQNMSFTRSDVMLARQNVVN